MTDRNSQLQAIHTAARAKGLIDGKDKSLYTAMLWSVARVNSAADLDSYGRARVLDHLNGGYKARQFRKGSKQALIFWIWSKLHARGHVTNGSVDALRAWVREEAARFDAAEVELEFQTPKVLSALINQLKCWAARCEVVLDVKPKAKQ
jgi:hypothetical protein